MSQYETAQKNLVIAIGWKDDGLRPCPEPDQAGAHFEPPSSALQFSSQWGFNASLG